MAISTNGTVIARLAGGLYNTVMSNATYLEVAAQDPSTLANTLYARDFAKSTDLAVATTLVTNLGLSSVAGLANWVAAQLTAAGAANKGAKVVSLLNDFAGMTADTTYGAQATAFNTKVDAALAASQKTGATSGVFADAGTVAVTGATFALTAGVDSGALFTGGAGNDSFTATGATLTVNDVLIGGAGTDSLTISDLTGGLATGVPTGVSVTGIESVVATTSGSIGSIATTTPVAVSTAVAQVNSLVYTKTDAAGITLTIGGAEYKSGALTEDATGVNAATAAVTLINAAIGGSQAARSAGTVTITASVAGKSLPTISGSTVTTAAAPVKNSPVAIKEVATFTITNTSTQAMTVYIDGVKYTALSGANATTAGDALASIINSVLGAGVAANVSGVVTVTAPVAGVGLPIILPTIAGGMSVATAYPIPNQVAIGAAVAATPYSVSGWTDLTSFDGTATTAANVTAAKTTDLKLAGTAVVTSGAKDVTVAASDSVFVSGAAGVVKVTTGTTGTTLAGAVSADVSGGTATDATGVYVTGGTAVTVTGSKLTTDVKVGAAPYSKAGVNTSGYPTTNGNSAKTPTGDVSITKVTPSTSTSTGVVTGTYGVGSNTVYTNGATSVTAKGAATTVITDAATLYLQASADVNSAPGTSKLATVTLAGLSGSSTHTIKSDAIATVNVSDTLTSQTVTITNSGALNANNGAITLNVSNVGTSGGARLTLDDSTATSVNVGTLAASSYGKVATGTATAVDSNTGSKSYITLTTPKATSITMTNALAVDIGTVGGTTSGVQKVGTVNASGATGSVTATIGAAQEAGMIFTGGSGADTVTLTGDVSVTSTTKATSVSLGAGNDKLLNSSATTTFTGASFDGGEGNDTVAVSLVTIGNASKFTSFETLGLDIASAGTRDVSIIGGITGLNLLANSTGVVTYSGATQAQSLTITGASTGGVSNTGGTTDIDFGTTTTATTDAYTITFAGAGTSSSTVASPTTVNAGIVKIAGIEAVSLVSAGTNFTKNTIALTDSSARTLTITGDKAATVTFDTAFGTASTTTTSSSGVSLIDASALTGKLVLTASSVLGTAYAGITIKGGTSDDTITLAAQTGTGRYTVDAGAGNDTITTSTTAATLTLGAGTDTVDASLTVAGSAFATAPVFTTITDFVTGDKIIMGNTTVTTAGKTFVTSATSLVSALTLACSNIAAGETAYFVYGGDTYIVADDQADGGFSANDIVVKLTGVTGDLTWTSTGNSSGLIGAA